MLNVKDTSINHKFILGCDASWFRRSRVAVVAKNPEIDLSFKTNPEVAKIALKSKWTLDLCNELKRMEHFVDDVIMCEDDTKKSLWRMHEPLPDINKFIPNACPPEELIETEGYKGTRVYDESIDWYQITIAFNEWLDAMQQIHGVRHIKVGNAEADDVLALTALYANHCGRNFCYMGTDKDLIQIAGENERTGAISVYCQIKNGSKANNWAKSRVLTCTSNIKKGLESQGLLQVAQQTSIFDEFAGAAVKPPKNEYDAIIKYSDYFNVEHPASFLWYKIVLGDSGDNVPELFAHLKKRGKNNAHLSVPQIYDTLIELGIETDNSKDLSNGLRYMVMDDLYNDEFIDKFCQLAYCKFLKTDTCPANVCDWLMTRFMQSRKMVCLNTKELPRPIIEMYRSIAESYDWNRCYCDVSKLTNFQETVQALGLGKTATVDRSQSNIDSTFADNFISGLIL